MHGGPSDVFVHEPVTFIKLTMQNEMHVRVHQGKCKDCNIVILNYVVNPVHTIAEILFAVENGIYFIAIGVEMPAIPDFNFLSLNEADVQA